MLRVDKAHHVVYSFALAVAGAFFFGLWWGLILSAAAGVVKEIYDEWSLLHRFDRWDLVANVVGLLLAWIVIGRVF